MVLLALLLVGVGTQAVTRSRSSVDGNSAPVAMVTPVATATAAMATPTEATPAAATPELVPVELVQNDQRSELPPMVPVAAGLLAEISVTRGTAQYERIIQIRLVRMTEMDKGVTGADVSAWSMMNVMGHGGAIQQGEELGDGYYRLPMAFSMPGSWQVDITIDTGQENGTVSIQVPALD